MNAAEPARGWICWRVCSWCKCTMGTVPCELHDAGKITHGMCDACLKKNLDEVAAVQAESTPPGIARPLQGKGTIAPGAVEPAAKDNLSGGPATSFKPRGGFATFIDRLIKGVVTFLGGGRST